jgi:hypothetical protein
MFCLGEESLAAHMGERKPREDLDAIAQIAESQVENKDADDDMPELELVRNESSLSKVEVSV